MGRHFVDVDWISILLLFCLSAFGLFLLLTLGVNVFWQQFMFVVVAGVLVFLFSRLDPVALWWAAPFAYIGGCIFLALSYLGPSIRGATRWIMIGPVQLQPSELSKPLFLLAFSYLITRYSPRNPRYLLLHMGLFALPFLLVYQQPDLGSSLIYAVMWVAMMLAGGMSVGIVALVGAIGALCLPLIWAVLLPYQKNRIITFLDPQHDPGGAGYNALQAMISVGSGQWFGRGLGRGTQSQLQFLPEHHTDFIFATLIEELGFIGGLVLLVLYACLLYRILLPLMKPHHDKPGFFVYSLGLFAVILSQMFINSAMNMGIIPITGITLPFVSYGGSSLLSFAISFGMLWALQRGKSSEGTIAIR
jgi:rod shape determining protein RodA